MLTKFVAAKLIENLEFQPTSSQMEMVAELGEFISSDDPEEIMMVKGYAGTGKTTLVNSLVKTLSLLKQKSILLAPTGRAAKVLSAYTHHPERPWQKLEMSFALKT